MYTTERDRQTDIIICTEAPTPLTSPRVGKNPKLTLQLKARPNLCQLYVAVVCLLVDVVPEEKPG